MEPETHHATTDELEQQLVDDEKLIGRLRARQAAIVAALDTRQVALSDGCRTLSEWVASRADMSMHTARKLVGTSRRMVDRPDVHQELGSGRITYERAQQIAKLAPDLDHEIYGVDQLRRLVARQTELLATDEAAAFEARYLHLQPSLDYTSWKLWGQLAGIDGAIVQDALFARADQLPAESKAGSRAAASADALVAICQDTQTTGTAATNGAADQAGQIAKEPSVTVFVNATEAGPTIGTIAAGPIIGRRTLEEILCVGTVEAIAVTADGKPLSAGRRTATIPPRLRKFIIGRDDGCSAAGCTSRYRLQVHHRQHWADGGPTDAANLVTLCWYHHHVIIHQRGFSIDLQSPPNRLRFVAPPARAPDHLAA
ncbi:MAG: HNH endonuclease [Acidimicrobiia bacterium]|nr:HNH endonuclease [Acidimicrobiia bacterium]MDH5504098.1 HNH endonuclease [Acidimicrobiia bacterium]